MKLCTFAIIFLTVAREVYPYKVEEYSDVCHCVPLSKCRDHFVGVDIRNIERCDDISKINCCYPNIITECGIKNVGEGAFPWMVEISVKTNFDLSPQYLGGGSLILPEVVLTAAHKVYNIEPRNLILRAGVNERNRLDDSYPVQKRSVSRKIVHENFNKKTGINGIALLIVDKPFVYNLNIAPICRNSESTVFGETECYVSGWGVNAVTRKSEYSLKQIQLPIVPNSRCQKMFRRTELGRRFKLHESFICAGGEEGKDACFGDGGSPLVCKMSNTNNTFFQVGIVSWGLGCGRANIPGAYISTAKYSDWIEDKISDIRRSTMNVN